MKLMTSLSVSMALILAASVACACARKDSKPAATSPAPATVSAPVTDAPKAATKVEATEKSGRRTLFERYEKRHKCKSNPAMCDGDFFEIDVKKSVEKEIDPDSNLSTEFSVGGCAKKSVLQWSLEWQ